MIKNIRSFCLISLPFIVIAILSGCYYDNEEDLYPGVVTCDSTSVSYSASITAVLNTSCAGGGCHSGSDPAGNVAFNSYAPTKAYFDIAGKKTEFIRRITWPADLDVSSRMPLGQPTKLDSCTTNKIISWLNAGYPDN